MGAGETGLAWAGRFEASLSAPDQSVTDDDDDSNRRRR